MIARWPIDIDMSQMSGPLPDASWLRWVGSYVVNGGLRRLHATDESQDQPTPNDWSEKRKWQACCEIQVDTNRSTASYEPTPTYDAGNEAKTDGKK